MAVNYRTLKSFSYIWKWNDILADHRGISFVTALKAQIFANKVIVTSVSSLICLTLPVSEWLEQIKLTALTMNTALNWNLGACSVNFSEAKFSDGARFSNTYGLRFHSASSVLSSKPEDYPSLNAKWVYSFVCQAKWKWITKSERKLSSHFIYVLHRFLFFIALWLHFLTT